MRRKKAKPVGSRKTAILLGGMAVLVCVCSAVFAVRAYHTRATQELKPRTLEELLAIPDEDLGRVDIARMNLLCAQGLPGAENIDVDKYLATIDQWAKVVKAQEEKYTHVFPRYAAKYENSLAKFKAVYLVLAMKGDLKCRYNMELVHSGAVDDMKSLRFFEDSRDLFIHGFIERKKGTCASIPVLAVALGRRCGYPLYLVSTKAHGFFRWEDGKEKFNVDTSLEGADILPDEHYHNHRFPTTEAERAVEKFLTNHTPVETLSSFMGTRASCLHSHGKSKEAVEAYTIYLRGFPESQFTRRYIAECQWRMNHEK